MPCRCAPAQCRARLVFALMIGCLPPAAAADPVLGNPCAKPCHSQTCGSLNVSFSCDVLSSSMGCDCTGCCLASRITAELSDFSVEDALHLSKTATANAEHTLKLTIGMDGTDVGPAHWSIERSSVPSWLSPSSYSGFIGPTERFGEVSLTASTSGLSDSTAAYTAEINLNVASQLNQSFTVPVMAYVRAPTFASRSIWGHPNHETRECQANTSSLDDAIEVGLGDILEVAFTACDFEGWAVESVHGGSFQAELIDPQGSRATHPLPIAYGGAYVGAYALDCPCLKSYPDHVQLNGSFVDVEVGGKAFQYPSHYGLKDCTAHDVPLPPFCATTTPGGPKSWCSQPWCYVDGDACNVDARLSTYMSGTALHYSYAACGNKDDFTSSYLQQRPPPAEYVIALRTDHLSGRRLGTFGLRLSFTPTGGAGQLVGVERSVLAVCPPGHIELSGGISCGCPAGEYLKTRACEPCQLGQYCLEGAIAMGSRCPTGLTTDGRGTKSLDECGCPMGMYGINDAAGNVVVCEPCHDAMNCTRFGLTTASVPLLPSRWRLSNLTASTYECESFACLGGDWNGASDGYCTAGHKGPRCELCSDPNQYYNAATATCNDCGNLAAYASKHLCILLAIIIFLALLRFALLKSPRLLARVSKEMSWLAILAGRFGFKSKYEPHLSNSASPVACRSQPDLVWPRAQVQDLPHLLPSVGGQEIYIRDFDPG